MRSLIIALALLAALSSPVLASPAGDLCPNIPGKQSVVPDGLVRRLVPDDPDTRKDESGWACVIE